MAKKNEANANDNLGSFVDEVTPIPVAVTKDYIDLNKFQSIIGSNDVTDVYRNWLTQLLDIAISCNKADKKFLSLGEQLAFNTLAKLQIIY